MSPATHAVVPDNRNADILVGRRDGVTREFSLVHRDKAVVSVFDSCFLLGDGCWEGIRIKQGVMQFAKVSPLSFVPFLRFSSSTLYFCF